MTEIDLRVDVRGNLELRGFLSERGVRWRADIGVYNAPPPGPEQIAKIIEVLKDAPPYLIVTGGIAVVIMALTKYAKAKRKRLIVERSLKGTRIDATNYSVDEFNNLDLGVMDYVTFEHVECIEKDT